MEGTVAGSSSAIDARAARVKLDFTTGRGHGARPPQGFTGDQDALAAVPQWDCCE